MNEDSAIYKDSFLSEVFGPLDNSKISSEFGWQPRPVDETVKDAISWFTAQKTGQARNSGLTKQKQAGETP